MKYIREIFPAIYYKYNRKQLQMSVSGLSSWREGVWNDASGKYWYKLNRNVLKLT